MFAAVYEFRSDARKTSAVAWRHGVGVGVEQVVGVGVVTVERAVTVTGPGGIVDVQRVVTAGT